MAAIHVPPGFRVELVAAEPMTMDPVAFAWGTDGRLWIVEMGDYPLGVDGRGKAGGRVRFLEDTNGDGRYDRSTVFLEGLAYPDGVMPWRGGVLVTCAPEIFFAEDTDGDGVADRRETLFIGFHEGNPQHRVNGLRWGLDGWVHCANGDTDGEILSTKTGKKVQIRGRDFRIRPDTGEIEPVAGPTQYARDCDDWGNWFGSSNSHPLFHYALDERYLARNPHVAAPPSRREPSVEPGAAMVYPRSQTVARFNDLSKSNRFTSACGAMIYRDDLLGDAFRGNMLVCEPVHNLVHREVLTPDGVSFIARRAAEEERSEFLASTDNWFRPAMVRTGVDGALWVVDMYRAVIEHPEWIPKEWQEKLDLRAGHDRGRIYRVYHQSRPPRPAPRIDTLSTADLAAALNHSSGAYRDLVQQELLWRGDRAAVPALARMARDTALPAESRLAALTSAEALAAGDEALLLAMMSDRQPALRRHAVRLSEPRLNESKALAAGVAQAANDDDAMVVLQAAYSLGERDDVASGAPLASILSRHGEDIYLRAAAISSIHARNVAAVVERVFDRATVANASSEVIETLAVLSVVLDKSGESPKRVAEAFAAASDIDIPSWHAAAARGLLAALSREAGRNKTDLRTTDETAFPAALAAMLDRARALAASADANRSSRLTAISLLGRRRGSEDVDAAILVAIVSPREDERIANEALAALARLNEPSVASRLLAGWKSFGPRTRSQVLDLLLARSEWVAVLLDHLEGGEVPVAELDAARRTQLAMHRDDTIRRRAGALFSTLTTQDRRAVVEAYAGARDLRADTVRGAEIFRKNCATCHRLGEIGFAVGPDLAALSDRSFEAIAVAVLDPNRAVEARFVGYTAVDNSGLAYTGLLTSENDTSVMLAAADGRAHTLLRADLEELASSSMSFMPEGLEKQLSPQDLADVAAYVASHRAPRREFAGNQPEVVCPEALRGEFWLLASQCEIYGETLIYSAEHAALESWKSVNDRAVWSLAVSQSGKYDVSIEYSCAAASAGEEFELSVAGQSLRGVVAETDGWRAFEDMKLGTVELAAGERQLSIRATRDPERFLLDLRAVRLRPVRAE